MTIKPSKSKSISIVKGKLARHIFFIDEEPIASMAKKPIKSPGHWFDSSVSDTAQVDQIKEDTSSSLRTIDETLLPGRLKLLCLQFGLLPCLMGLLTISDLPLSEVDKLEQLVIKSLSSVAEESSR